MPNHCYQQVHIEGPRDVVQYLYHSLSENGRFCDVVSPMPLKTYLLPDVDETEKYGFETKTPAWYYWRLGFWGTKWDVCEVEIVEELTGDQGLIADKFYDGARSWFAFRCWTAWGPPIPIWKKLHNMGIRINAEYQDEGMDFEGSFIDGVDKAWRPHIDEVIEEDEACRYK